MQSEARRGRHTDWSIPGDEQENERIRLEQEMISRVADLTFDNTSTHSTESSVEYPRHLQPNDGPYPPPLDVFPTFSLREPHDFSQFIPDDTEHSAPNLRSFQHTIDDSAMTTGETLSTAQHHASAVTLGAGLGGALGRTPSRSGIAEFDPDRPLPNFSPRRGLRDVLGESITMNQSTQFERPTRQTNIAASLSVDPIIVEDTAELERALESGYLDISHDTKTKQTNMRHISPRIRTVSDPEEDTSSSSQQSDSGSSASSRASRAKLTETLQSARGTFSPRRPRVATNSQRRSSGQTRENLAARGASTSKFTEARREIERDIKKGISEGERYRDPPTSKPSVAPSIRAPLSDVRNHLSALSRRANRTSGSVHLPDVTGLTSAVDTPIKSSRRYRSVRNGAVDATVVQSTIDELAHRIRDLEKENINSRRHVRELEDDLERCREEVVRERNRVQAEIQKQLQHAQNIASTSDRKGKGRADTVDAYSQSNKPLSSEELRKWEVRYRDVVDTKRELETLVMTLRQQLAQMTSELDVYKQAVDELRALHEEDEAEIEKRSQEVEELRAEVERLGNEVMRLRDIIEDSVRERREVSQQREDFQLPAQNAEEQQQEQKEEQEVSRLSIPKVTALSPVPEESSQDPRLLDTEEIPGNARPVSRASDFDKSNISVDELEFKSRATVGSSFRTMKRFITDAELERVESDVEERRSFLSGRMCGDLEVSSCSMAPPPRLPGPSTTPKQLPIQLPVPRVTVSDYEAPRKPQTSKPRSHQGDPFPTIRGARMEKLFFSLPDHNETTCHVCRKRRANEPNSLGQSMDGRNHPARGRREDDKDLPNTSEVLNAAMEALDRAKASRSARGEYNGGAYELDDAELPPQTVVARAVRELEDDFTHYKSIYFELAEQYGSMDPATNVLKRNVLAEHLKQIIDSLEIKGDQIAAFYELLAFRDTKSPTATGSGGSPLASVRYVPDVARTKAARRERLRLWNENRKAARGI
ncbi:uncharacterized protein EI90DRAFT_3121870 [Cantharellus anzutake]|uniref:uncharacterized protein n=1 Tax=Cantharellus anzutake TaxID=1750568 RepID=UPI0019083426|nr:uncharacterized protein EI90DRAFT_3121870 [Cantharellus anzutake]KAF8333529.1 hypothetical protein EI90DRAFT_3121870 [Cantharellus anzutake]